MASRTEFGLPPKKKVTTYGKASRRGAFDAMRRTESSPAAVKVQTPDSETSVEHPAESRTEPPSQRSTPERAGVAQRAPLKSSKTEEHFSRSKKRKVELVSSTNKKETTAVWSPPSSPPPPPRSAAPKGNPRKYGTKTSSAQTSSTRAGRTADGPTEEVKDAGAPFSTKTTRILHDLSINNATPAKTQSIPLRLTRAKPAPSSSVAKKAPKMLVEEAKKGLEMAVEKAKGPEPPPPRRPRKRLIDALAAQVEDSSDSSEDEQRSSQEAVISMPSSPIPMLFRDSPPPPIAEQPKPRTLQRQISMTKKPGPKFTYSQQRSMLAEDSMLELAGLADVEEDSQPRAPFLGFGSQSQLSQMSAFTFDDAEDDTGNDGQVRGLHELRQSGANLRTNEQLDDILMRVGSPSPKPSSLRRGALLELAQKMKDQSSRRQFRNHRDSGVVFRSLAEETDIVAGYAVISILTTLLATSPSQHLIQQLQPKEIASLLLVLMEVTSDISVVVKDRKRNVSRNAQATLSTIKAAILQLPTWEPISPTFLSPRTLALKALNLLAQHGASETELFTPAVTDRLFSVLSSHTDPACWDFPQQPESIDFYLALSLLEQHSVSAMQSTDGSRWNSAYLPIVADILGVALQRPADKFDDLESVVLKLTLNTTNNNHEAGRMFVDRGLLRDLAEAACRAFDVVLKSIMDDAFMSKVLDSLILMLGVGINFCEHYPPAAQNLVNGRDGEMSTLDRLIRLFLDYHATTADADSMEKTQLNVAFSYHAILLGYLCLHAPVRERFMSIHSKRSLEPLLESIREFIVLHRRTLAVMDGEAAGRPEANAVNRLQSLVNELEARQ